LVIVFIIHKI